MVSPTVEISNSNAQKAIQCINGTYLSGPDAANLSAPLPFPKCQKIICVCCLLQGSDAKFTNSTYYQNHGSKCKHFSAYCSWYTDLVESGVITIPPGIDTGLPIVLPPASCNQVDDVSDEQKRLTLEHKLISLQTELKATQDEYLELTNKIISKYQKPSIMVELNDNDTKPSPPSSNNEDSIALRKGKRKKNPPSKMMGV